MTRAHRLGFMCVPLAATLTLAGVAGAAGPKQVSVAGSGILGTASYPPTASGQPCDPVDAIAFSASASLSGSSLTSTPTTLALSLGILPGATGGGWLVPDASRLTFSNTRGTLPAAMRSGDCQSAGMTLSAGALSGSGSWQVDSGAATGSFRQATGSGIFSLQAGLQSGGGNSWAVNLTGNVAVLQPALSVSLARATWAHRPGDPAGRIATVTYRLANTGAGDGFAGDFQPPDAPEGFTLLGVSPSNFGDIAAGNGTEVSVRWAAPHGALREFDTTVHLRYTDALDQPTTTNQLTHVVIPSS